GRTFRLKVIESVGPFGGGHDDAAVAILAKGRSRTWPGFFLCRAEDARGRNGPCDEQGFLFDYLQYWRWGSGSPAPPHSPPAPKTIQTARRPPPTIQRRPRIRRRAHWSLRSIPAPVVPTARSVNSLRPAISARMRAAPKAAARAFRLTAPVRNRSTTAIS